MTKTNSPSEETQARHTPGPWSVMNRYGSVWAGDYRIANMTHGEHGYDYTAEANARLIAAAPDLLQSLKDCAAHLRGALGADIRPRSDSGELYTEALAAIAKAEGEARHG